VREDLSKFSNQSKMTWSKVDAIRKSKGEITQRELAEIYGVSRVTIARIQANMSWKEK